MEEFTAADLINVRSRFSFSGKPAPRIDEEVSKIVGKTVLQNDPRLIKLIVKWKGNKPHNSMEPDNFLRDPDKLVELKKVFS